MLHIARVVHDLDSSLDSQVHLKIIYAHSEIACIFCSTLTESIRVLIRRDDNLRKRLKSPTMCWGVLEKAARDRAI